MDDTNTHDHMPTSPGLTCDPGSLSFPVPGSGGIDAATGDTPAPQPSGCSCLGLLVLVSCGAHPCEVAEHPSEEPSDYDASKRGIPPWLTPLRRDLDLRNARSRPTALARLVFVVLLLHRNQSGFAWPGRKHLADLARAREGEIRKAIRLLEERGAIIPVDHYRAGQRRRAWRFRLEPQAVPLRLYWPEPRGAASTNDTTAFVALAQAFESRNHVAAITMLYQFARTSEYPPNLSWISDVIGTSVDTVRRARNSAIERGLATQVDDGRLVFADPEQWPGILGVQPSPARRTPCSPSIGPARRIAHWRGPTDPGT